MVIAWIHLFLLLPCVLLSAEFSASVSKNEVGLGEGFMLDLTLKDTSAKTPPLVEPLKQAFLIYSQQQSSNTTMINGKVSSSLTRTLALVSQVVGEVQIPPIGIETSEGKLFTQPIAIRIAQERKSLGSQPGEEVRLETEASSLSPYKNEPFFLTARLISQRTLANLQVEKFEVEGVIVESAGEPIIGEKIEKGMKVGVVEFKYLVTPLKSGSLKIPSITIQGGIPQRRSGRSPFDARSLFDDAFDPFSLMQGLVSLQPFVLTTKELVVEIRPPVGSVIPWLPARALEIRENWDGSQTFQEGEVFTRSFVIAAEGIHSSQLPSLKERQDRGGQFKVYADKPELKDEIVDGRLKSYRIEQYTLIPQKSGELALPEISVDWWDTGKGEKREARIQARPLQVLPALVSPMAASHDIVFMDERKLEAGETQKNLALVLVTHPFAYVLIGGLVILLAIVLVLLILLQRKMKRLLEIPTEKKIKTPKEVEKELASKNEPSPRRKREKLDDLNPT